jgi:hypothetical protein
MPLIKCVECGKDVSTLAKSCPHCGCPAPAAELQRVDVSISPFSPEAERISRYRFIYIKQRFPVQLMISAGMFVMGTLVLFEPHSYRVDSNRVSAAVLLIGCSILWFYRLSRRAGTELPASVALTKSPVPGLNSLLFYILAFVALLIFFFSLIKLR